MKIPGLCSLVQAHPPYPCFFRTAPRLRVAARDLCTDDLQRPGQGDWSAGDRLGRVRLGSGPARTCRGGWTGPERRRGRCPVKLPGSFALARWLRQRSLGAIEAVGGCQLLRTLASAATNGCGAACFMLGQKGATWTKIDRSPVSI